jgi:hypothetical protein
MTVAELIQKLATFPLDAQVELDIDHADARDVSDVQLSEYLFGDPKVAIS